MKTAQEQYANALRKVPVDSSKFAYVGVIGSTSRDVDVLMLPNQEGGYQFGEFHNAVYALLDMADEEFRRRTDKITARAPMKHLQATTEHLIAQEQGVNPLSIHTLNFFDKDSFYIINPKRFLETCMQNNMPIHGDLDSAVSQLKDTESRERLFLHTLLANYNVSQTAGKIPRSLTYKQEKELSDYFSKWYGIKIPCPRDPEGCKRHNRELISTVDTLARFN